MKKSFLLFLLLGLCTLSHAQILRPVKWNFSAKPAGGEEVLLTFTADIQPGWHIYSLSVKPGGPVATSFKFEPAATYELAGKITEATKPETAYEEMFRMEISSFEDQAVFTQKVRLKAATATISGTLEYMVCDDNQCLPPEEVAFSIAAKVPEDALKGQVAAQKTTESAPVAAATPNKPVQQPVPAAKVTSPPVASSEAPAQPATATPNATELRTITQDAQPDEALTATNNEEKYTSDTAAVAGAVAAADKNGTSITAPEPEPKRSLLTIFLAGLIGGIAALLMPCIFPMLPLTVSYFTKQDKGSAVSKALFYGMAIIVIYVALGLLVTVLFGADALNELSTNGIFNFFFFLLLVVFAASFLGAFELTLPASWVNKADAKADKGGLVGIFFMAATLALVSFSCTGPIIGTLLVQAAAMGDLLGPATGMLGFSVALAAPFSLFALFPSWMNKLPRSGGWLNSVKVVLGFLELALALKFLSNVDLAYHWEWFDREVFLSLWVIIFGLMGLYLLGKLRLSHDSEQQPLSVMRLGLAIVTLSFTLYLVPGLWGAPLSAVSAFLPPQHTQDFDLYTASLSAGYTSTVSADAATQPPRKYSELFHAPLGLQPFFDYEEGMAYARKVNKPVMIDFTGHACVNCRKMEASVWPDKQVLQRLREEYVLIQLYVDDKTALPADEQYVSDFSGKNVKTIGNKWSDFQASRFNTNSQPYYVLLNEKGDFLAQPQGADYNAESYLNFLDAGLQAFRKPYTASN